MKLLATAVLILLALTAIAAQSTQKAAKQKALSPSGTFIGTVEKDQVGIPECRFEWVLKIEGGKVTESLPLEVSPRFPMKQYEGKRVQITGPVRFCKGPEGTERWVIVVEHVKPL